MDLMFTEWHCSDPVDPDDPLGLAGIDLEAMAAAGREERATDDGSGIGSNIDVDFSNIDPEAMASANQIMDQLREQGWKPPEARSLPSCTRPLQFNRAPCGLHDCGFLS